MQSTVTQVSVCEGKEEEAHSLLTSVIAEFKDVISSTALSRAN